MPCGCTHRFDPETGVKLSKQKCQFHLSAQRDPATLGEEYFADFGFYRNGEIQPSAHVQEMTDHIGPFRRVNGDSCLEVGCGISPYANELTRLGYRYLGVDPSSRACEIMNSLFIESIIIDMPFEEADSYNGIKFELILCAHALEHMADPVAALKKMESLLAPNGQLRIVVPHGDDDPWNEDHLAFFTPETLKRCVEHAGLNVIFCKEARIVPKERFIYLLADRGEIPRTEWGVSGQIWTTKSETQKLIDLIPPNGTLMEIGSCCGGTAAVIADARKDARIISVDPYPDINHRHNVLFWIDNKRPNSLLITASARELVDTYRNSISVVFVDGDHTYAAVSEDLVSASQVVASDGLIVAHDYHLGDHPQVTQAIDDFCSSSEWSVTEVVGSLALLRR